MTEAISGLVNFNSKTKRAARNEQLFFYLQMKFTTIGNFWR